MNIFKLLIILVAIYIGYKVVMMFKRPKHEGAEGYRMDNTQPKGEDLVQDPFCKTYVPKSQAYVQDVEGRQEYFCSQTCCEKYLSEKK